MKKALSPLCIWWDRKYWCLGWNGGISCSPSDMNWSYLHIFCLCSQSLIYRTICAMELHCCPKTKYALAHQTCSNLQLKTALKHFAPVWVMFAINYSGQLLNETIYLWAIMYVFKRNNWVATDGGSQKVLRDGLTDCWFWSFCGICWQNNTFYLM